VNYPLLFEAITAIATLAVPVVVAVMAGRFNNQLKKWEANQWRNQELIRARLEYYRVLVPKLNDLMCYFTFIGSWKEMSPQSAIELKRTLDREFYCAAPLFGETVARAYGDFMAECFETFGTWGRDARLRTGFGRRREAAGASWEPAWEAMFSNDGATPITQAELTQIRDGYNALIATFAMDIELNVARDRYVSADITPSAH
jgi:hypothetical protein